MFTFRAMGTQVAVVAAAEEERVAARVAATFWDAERRFSRFRADSELSRLNAAQGPVVVSRPLFEALERARTYLELTEGLFDPGVGSALVAFGYDRSFAPGALDADRRPPRAGHHSLREVALDPARNLVTRPDHVRVDLGGMIKGATADQAARHLPRGGVIDAGGDAVMVGAADELPWEVEVEDPEHPERTIATVAVRHGAVATSAPNRRRWRLGGTVVHHLIDPRTGAPACTDLAQVTVFAPAAELAEVLAKAAFLLGSAGARRLIERLGHAAVLVPSGGGRPVFVGQLEVLEEGHA